LEAAVIPIPPTLSLDEAGGRIWDVLVVGAGPAGALAARELARREAAVLLVDKAAFPRWKVCGCCLNQRALATLAAVGLGGLPGQLGAVPLSRMHLAASRRVASLTLPGGVSLSREAFDASLVQAAIQAGAAFLPRTQAVLAVATARTRGVSLRQDGRSKLAAARVVLAADGLGGKFLAGDNAFKIAAEANSRIGAGVVAAAAPEEYGPGTIFMACGAGGYVGLVRLEDRRLDIAAALDPALVRDAAGLGQAAARLLNDAGLPPVPDLAGLPWRGTPLLTRRAVRPACTRAFAVGDAAGYVEPFTGEGMAWALASGVAIAPLALRAVQHWDLQLVQQWSTLYRYIVARRQRACRIVAALLRRPALTSILVGVLKYLPVLASPLVHYLNYSPTPRKAITA
jgi:flavin-dependent dehydrogenase